MNPALLAFLAMSALAAPAADYTSVIPEFEAAVRAEFKEWEIEGVATAWVDGTSMVYEGAFGESKTDSVFRAGSVSKLFNAVAVTRLAEEGKVNLDAPVPPAMLPENPFPGAPAVTLRQLLSHRSGLQRESTVGGYFDPAEPTLEATVSSLRGSTLVSVPGSENRYSNIGPSLAGLIAARAAGKSYSALQEDLILKPLGMKRSAWIRKELPAGVDVPSHIRVADGKGGFARRATPLFDLGTVPAGNLYTTAGDLARFVAMLAADGDSPGGRILPSGVLAKMWEPQIDPKGTFGLGFSLGEWRGRKTVGHGGAVYGHSTALIYLPSEKIGAVVMCNEDIVNGASNRLANLALSLMMKAKSGEAPPPAPAPLSAAETADLAAFSGSWESVSFWLDLKVEGSALRGVYSSQPCVLTPAGKDAFTLTSRIHDGVTVTVERDARGNPVSLLAGPQRFTRVPGDRAPLPAEWKPYHGSYGPDFIPLVIFEKNGRLYATTENMVDYHLTPVNRFVFAFPPGMYVKEYLVFQTGPDGTPNAVDLANMRLPRHP